MARLKLALHLPRDLLLWAGITTLVSVGLLVTGLQHSSLSERESVRAAADHQRLIFDAAGHVLNAENAAKKPSKPSFDVAPDETEKPVEPDASTATPAEPEEKTPPSSVTEPVIEPSVNKKEHAASPEPTAPEKQNPKTTEQKTEAVNPEVSQTPSPASDATATATAPTPAEPASALSPLRTEPVPTTMPTAAAGPQSLIRAPAPEITETVDGIKIPKRGGNGTAPSSLYARRFKGDKTLHPISFVVMDAGLGTATLPLLMALPKEVTIALSPYGHTTASTIELLRNMGFEIWGMLPTMSDRYPQDDPGPMGLIQSMPKEELLRRLHAVMGATIGSVGMVLPPNETLSARATSFNHIITDIHARGLFMLSTNADRNLEQLSSNPEFYPTIARADIVLDPLPNEPQIKSKLAGITAAAKEKEGLIVVLSARPQSLSLLQQWLNSNAGVVLAPLSAHYEKPAAPAPAAEKKAGEKATSAEKKPEEKPEEKSAEKHTEKTSDKPAEKPAEKPTSKHE